MGRKHKHSKDKLYKTVSELDSHHIGSNRQLEVSYLHRRIKFDTCCLCLDTITNEPLGLLDETKQFCHIFDSVLIIRFLKKHQINPVTGQAITAQDLIKLKFHKNDQGQYHCPVTLKLFNQHSRLVANKRTGNVICREAYEQLNIKANHFKDLLTDEPFTRSDIVVIQEPTLADEKWNAKQFYHIRKGLKFNYKLNDTHEADSGDELDQEQSKQLTSSTTSDIVKQSLAESKKRLEQENEKYQRLFGKSEDNNTSSINREETHSDGRLARSVTSTSAPIIRSQSRVKLSDEQELYSRIKKAAYVELRLNLGSLNLELYCDKAPKTCDNFLQLATNKFYDKTIFHRLIKDFIIQGGDPTGTGKGGQSTWGSPFKDEIHKDLKHTELGTLAMANSGPNSNKSQFYITLGKGCDHLDGKHTIFGRVVGGLDLLKVINKLPVDKNDRPIEAVTIEEVIIFGNPFEETRKEIQSERDKEERRLKRKLEGLKEETSDEEDCKQKPQKKFHDGIGAYIDMDNIVEPVKSRPVISSSMGRLDNTSKKQTKPAAVIGSKKKYGDFSNW